MADPQIISELTSNLSEVLLPPARETGKPAGTGWLLFAIKHEEELEILFLPFGPGARILYALPYRQYFGLDDEDASFLRSVESAAPHLTHLHRLALRYAESIVHGLRQGLAAADAL